jgi:hypothetical protein
MTETQSSAARRRARTLELVEAELTRRYLGDFPRLVTIRENLRRICRHHIELGLADATFSDGLCSGDDGQFWQRLSEVLLAHELLCAGLHVHPSPSGPDFRVVHEGRNIWIEVVCPEPIGLPSDWLDPPIGQVHSYPHEAMLLRWTAAIKEKAEKLVGSVDGAKLGYLRKGFVGKGDAYVIAVNGRRLRGRHFSALTGISQFPFAVEAVFSVGPLAIKIDVQTGQSTPAEHTHRPLITKPKGAAVPAYTFLDPRFDAVSAIWACDIDETWVIGNPKHSAVVHNPMAINEIPVHLLPSESDYVATSDGPDFYLLEKRVRPA